MEATRRKLEKRIFNRILWHRKCNYKRIVKWIFFLSHSHSRSLFLFIQCVCRSLPKKTHTHTHSDSEMKIRHHTTKECEKCVYFISRTNERTNVQKNNNMKKMVMVVSLHRVAHLLFSFSRRIRI